MTDALEGQRDFFVSFNQADRSWATWIAWALEEAGYSAFFQDWDFKGNFVLEMDRAHTQSRRTIAVLSPDYLTSHFTAPEWAARFAGDATSQHDLLIPIRVRPCKLQGLLAQITYTDLVGVSRDEACQRLLDRVAGIRLKPKEEPFFPGDPLAAAARSIPSEPRFPIATHNLPPFNPDFVGREPVLAELRRLLTSGRGPAVLSQAISGLGGVGKTQTALAYCYRHLADYTLVWWLRAEMKATLDANFTTLAVPLGLDPAAADQKKLIASIRAALQAREDWLLVFDNVEDTALSRMYLPTTGKGHALITSRRTDWQGIAKALALEVMQEGEALQLLTGRPDPDALPVAERSEAKALAKKLGYLPLALAQARAYMGATGKSLAGYRRLFEASRPAVLERGRASRDYPTSVAKTWQISIQAAESVCAAARPLLELLAFFAPDILPVEVLAAQSKALPDGLREELARDEAIAALKLFSMIQAENDALTMHRLVQAVTRDALDFAIAQARAEAVVRLVGATQPNSPLLPHVLAAVGAAVQFHVDLPAQYMTTLFLTVGLSDVDSMIDSMIDTARVLLLDGNYDEAYDFVRSAAERMENEHLLSRGQAACLLIDISKLFMAIQDFGRAAEIVKSASATLLNQNNGYNEAASVYRSFADELFDRGQYGWAGSRYYNAAIIFIMDANIVDARKCLEWAFNRFEDISNDFWTKTLQTHLSILQETDSTEEQLSQLAYLQSEFHDMSRENWAEACKIGARKIKEKTSSAR